MILSRYIIREHIGPFTFGLSLIAFIFTMNLMFQMLKRIAGKGLPVMVIVEYFALNLAWILALAVPMAVLISTLSAFGRMAGDGEITALRASGVSPLLMIRPALWGGLFMTILVFLFNNYVLPDMNHRAKLLLTDISRKKPTLNIEPGIYTFTIPKLVLLAEDVDQTNGGLKNVTIYDERIPKARSVITAMRGRLQFIETEEIIRLTLLDGEIHRMSEREAGGWEWTQFDSALFRIRAPGMALKRAESEHRGERELSVEDMLMRVEDLKKEKPTQHTLRRISAYMVEIHKKMSIPVACLVFILMGAPLGILASKGGIGVSGGMSLLFFTVYWAFLINGEDLAERGFITPAVAMWSPNVLFAILGIWLLWLAGRWTSLPFVGWISNFVARLVRRGEK